MNPMIFSVPALEEGFFPLSEFMQEKPLSLSSYARARLLLLLSLEKAAIRLSREASPFFFSPEECRDLSLIRRGNTMQAARLSLLLSSPSGLCEEAIFHAFLSSELCSSLAQRLEKSVLRDALQFILPEQTDELYRLSNLFMFKEGKAAETLLSRTVEIMPGRPIAACHRHPYDLLMKGLNRSDPLENAAVISMISVEEEKYAFYLSAAQKETDPLARSLYAELSLLAEEHLSCIASFLPAWDNAELMLNMQYAKAYFYHSFELSAENEKEREFLLHARDMGISHIQKMRSIAKIDSPLPDFPDPLTLGKGKGFVRSMLQNLGVTALRDQFVPVGKLPGGADFFRYQKKVVKDAETLPSHLVVQRLIEKTGTDYRFEIAPHPVEALRNRKVDYMLIGR